MNLSFIFITMFILLAVPTHSRLIEVPAYHDQTQLDIRIESLVEVQQPQFQFSKIYKREVFALQNNLMTAFPTCRENPPQVQFTEEDQIFFKGLPKKPIVKYTFSDIIHSQFILDAIYDNNRIIMMLQDGVAAVVTLSAGSGQRQIVLANFFPVGGLQKGDKLEIGYFVRLGGQILFINGQYAIRVEESSSYVIKGMENHELFETAVVVLDTVIAVGDRRTGVTFYQLAQDKSVLIKVGQITSEDFPAKNKKLDLSDLAYYAYKNSLLILDENEGVYSFSIKLSQSQQIQIMEKLHIARRSLCELMYIHEKTLYSACDQVFSYDLKDWPKITQKILTHPNIKVRAIQDHQDLLVFIGRNLFKLMYLERPVNYYQSDPMDKLIFLDDFYISVSENNLQIGSFQIIKPYITCRAKRGFQSGVNSLVFKTYAECNNTYFQQYKINANMLGNFDSSDICVYTVYKPIDFWRRGQINVLPIVISLIVLFMVVIVVVAVGLVKQININQIERELLEYQRVNTSQSSRKQYNQFNEEISEDSKGKTEDKLNHNGSNPISKQSQKQFELQQNMDHFDIQ